MDNKNITTFKGDHTQTTHHSLIPYDPKNSYLLFFKPVTITQSGETGVRLFAGCGIDNEYPYSTYVKFVISIHHTQDEQYKNLQMCNVNAQFKNKEVASVGEEPAYVAYYYWYGNVHVPIPIGHWSEPSKNMYMKFTVISMPGQGFGFFGGKFSRHNDQHQMTIIETKYEYENIETNRHIIFS